MASASARSGWRRTRPLSDVGFEVNPVLQGAPARPAQRAAPAGNGAPDEFSTPCQPSLTFENFITGESNALAHGLWLGVADGNLQPTGPLYLFGGVGLGKTHLMQALALRLRRDRPDCAVLYFNSDDFRQHYIDARECPGGCRLQEQGPVLRRVDDRRCAPPAPQSGHPRKSCFTPSTRLRAGTA